MANKLDPMDLKQIITLHLDGFSNRVIGGIPLDELGSRQKYNDFKEWFISFVKNDYRPFG